MKRLVSLLTFFFCLLGTNLVWALDGHSPRNSKPTDPSAQPAESTDKTVLKILTHNVGGSDFRIFNEKDDKLRSNCPLYKLCHTEIIYRVRAHLKEHSPDVAFYQEIFSIQQLLTGTADVPAILPENYSGQCGRGAGDLYEICIAWRRDKFDSVGECISISTGQSGALKCTLKSLVNNKSIDFINVHPSALLSADRRKLLNDVWTNLVDNSQRTIVGGDFNSYETYPENSDYPYPDTFGTVFGRVVEGYGRWPTTESFFGYRKIAPDGTIKYRKVAGSTIIFRKIDHLFANFGEMSGSASCSSLPCKNSVCLGNIEGYLWGYADWSSYKLGPKTDHLPVLANILF